MKAETPDARARRHLKRSTFDLVADAYDDVRAGYPSSIVSGMVDLAGLGPGDRVLELGCGTGQLTRQLAEYRFDITALDPAPSMIGVARRRLGEKVRWVNSTFEEFDPGDASFALVVSATAFHWIDPDVAYSKSAALLRDGGWLAVLGTGEHYDEPFGSALRDVWVRHSETGGAWVNEPAPSLEEEFDATELFEAAVSRRTSERGIMAAADVIKLEQTRASFGAYRPQTRASFLEDLRRLTAANPQVEFERRTSLTMARKR